MKRGKDTFFVEVDLENGAKAGELRTKAADMIGVELSRLRLCLLSDDDGDDNGCDLRDDERLSDQKVVNDCVICAVLRSADESWETPNVVYPPPVEPDMPIRGVGPKLKKKE